MENYIRWYDEAIPSPICDELINAFESSEHKVVRNKGGKRNTEVSLLPDHPMSPVLHTYIEIALVRYYKDNNFPALARYKDCVSESAAIKKYEPNDFHDWHTDSTGPFSFRRFLAIQCYLNTVENAGCTEFRSPESIEIQPVKGRDVFFPATWTHVHRGAPPIDSVKYSVNSYLLFPEKWMEEYSETRDKYRINSPNERMSYHA